MTSFAHHLGTRQRATDPDFAAVLAAWLDRVLALYGERILPLDLRVPEPFFHITSILSYVIESHHTVACDNRVGSKTSVVAMSETGEAKLEEQNQAAAALQAKCNQAMTLHQQGRLAEAERIYREVLQRQPNHFDALHLLGVIALQTRQTEQGVELIKKAIGLNADNAAAYQNLGKALLDLKRPAEALASYDKAIAIKPDYAEAYSNRGNAQLRLKRPAEALASYDNAIALKPDYAEAYSGRGSALLDLKRPEEALASYDKAIALKPDFAGAYNNRGNALRNLKRLADALASYNKAIALEPNFAEAYNNRSALFLTRGEFDKALSDSNKAIQLDPKYVVDFVSHESLPILSCLRP